MSSVSSKELYEYMNKQSCSVKLTPIKLNAHLRSITCVKFSPNNKLLITTAKDTTPMAWNVETGDLIGIYNGHNGAIWGCDINESSELLATVSSDQSTRIWNINTGEQLHEIEHESASRDVAFGKNNLIAIVTDNLFGEIPKITIYKNNIITHVHESDTKINKCAFNQDSTKLYFCSENGTVSIMNVENGNILLSKIIHQDYNCKKIRFEPNYKGLITSSNDHTSKLLDPRNLEIIKTYENTFPVNDSLVVNGNVKDHIILTGGIEAQSVTTAGNSKFDIKFYSKVLEEFLGSFSTHFGTTETIDMSSNSKYLASGGADGFCYIYKLSDDYFN